MRIFQALAAILILGSCAGPRFESQVASAIQTLMANLIEGSFPTLGASGSAPVNCSNGGSFSALDPNYGTIDPLDPMAASVSTPIHFEACIIKVCGVTLTLNGGGTSIELTVADLSGITNPTSNSVSIQIRVAEQQMSGIIEGTPSFSYKMTVNATTNSIESIKIEDNDPAQPLSYRNRTFNGSELDYLADGC